MPTDRDEHFIQQAIELAEQAIYCGEAPIAAILFDEKANLVAKGWNQRRSTGDITRHAEMVAFAAAAQPDAPQHEGLTLVSTLEPCVMCWGASLELKVDRIVFGLEAPPNGGSARVNDPDRQPVVVGNVKRDACRQLFVDWLEDNPDHAGARFVRTLLESTR